ncbi:MAG: aldehyde dehydrogenase family protein, partial [Burkholderiales bacterium]
AKLVTGGSQAAVDGKGFFYTPTVLANVSNSMRVAQEEIFGPVLGVIPFADIDDLIAQANDTKYGLAAGIWTKDIAKAHAAARALKAGSVYINTYGLLDPAAPFGGYKMSGVGREMGAQSIDMYTECKSVWTSLD